MHIPVWMTRVLIGIITCVGSHTSQKLLNIGYVKLTSLELTGRTPNSPAIIVGVQHFYC